MRQNDSFTTVLAWELTSRIVVVGLLVLSGLQFLAAAVVYRIIGTSEAENLIFAGSLLFAGIAFALALAFRKSGGTHLEAQGGGGCRRDASGTESDLTLASDYGR